MKFPVVHARCFASLLCVLSLSAALGCEREREKPLQRVPAVPAPTVPWSGPERAEELSADSVPRRELRLGETQRYPDCWEIFERGGEPVDPFPFADSGEIAERLVGCDIEARAELDDGTRLYAWATQPQEGSRASDLRLAAWEREGKLRWSHRLDRSKQAANWVANFRRSFVTPLPPRHVCYGTLWEGDTQVACVGLDDGAERWVGSLAFWSGITPVAGKDGLLVADLSALTERYPFSGEEMRHQKLEGLGGRSGFYAADSRRLYFAPSRTGEPSLVAYDFATFDEVWRVLLPTNPAPSLSRAFDEFELLLLKLDETLHAVDTERGEVRWSYVIGDDIPSIASHDGALYLLVRRPEKPNQLAKVQPKTGERGWIAPTPSGTLKVESVAGELVLGSVRAVQRVVAVDEPREADGVD